MDRKELITSKEYVVGKIQLTLLNMIQDYMVKKEIKRTELADELGVTKGYVSQLLNVAGDHKISKLVELSLSCNKMPVVNFVDLNEYINNDALDKIYELSLVDRDYSTHSNTLPLEARVIPIASTLSKSMYSDEALLEPLYAIKNFYVVKKEAISG